MVMNIQQEIIKRDVVRLSDRIGELEDAMRNMTTVLHLLHKQVVALEDINNDRFGNN
jgi:hypothetical protein